jgi:hypothetical protein
MEVEIEAMIEDTEILRYVSESQQSRVIKNIFYECTEDSQQRFISELEDSYLVKELERRGFTITKNK